MHILCKNLRFPFIALFAVALVGSASSQKQTETPLSQLQQMADAVAIQDLMNRGAIFVQGLGGPSSRAECRIAGNMSIMFGPNVSESQKQDAIRRVLESQGAQMQFQAGGRWSQTATNPSTGLTGDPISLTWSVVPDGINVPNSGLGSGPNVINAQMNGQFGGSLWVTKLQEAFDRWGQLSGVSYTQVGDDGASLHGSPGRNTAPIRGDVRISMITMTNNGVIAYNFFPNNGDMVLNRTFLGSFGNSSNNYRFLRNTVGHEHGHGFGLDHVDPTNGTKLMEAFLNTNFDHAQSDDIQGIQYLYGDPFENNDTSGTRTDLGTVSNNQTVNNLSTDKRTDVDWYRVIVPTGKTLTVTITPEGGIYQQGPQGGQTSQRNADAIHDLRLGAFLSDGVTQLGLANNTGAGQAETLTNIVPPFSNEIYIRVDAVSGTTNDIQRYRMTFNLAALTESYAPQSVVTTIGTYMSGNASSLASVDGDRYVVRQVSPFAAGAPTIRWAATSFGRANATLNTLTVRVVASIGAFPAGNVPQRLLLFNWNTNLYETVDTRPSSASDQTYDVVINSNAGRFINSATGEMRAQMEWFDPFNLANFGWSSRTDQLLITILYQ